MHAPAVPPDEQSRLALLHASKLMDGEVDPAFDALTRLAGTLLACPTAAINLVDAHQVWSLSRLGQGPRQSSRPDSFCWHVVQTGAPLVLGDALGDPRFAQIPPCTGPKPIRAYLGIPLKVEAQVLGTLCVMDCAPRAWTAQHMAQLQDLATATSALLASHLATQRYRLMEARVRGASLAGSDWLWETDKHGLLQWVSSGLLQHTGLDPSSEIGQMGARLYEPRDDDTRESWDRFQQARVRHEPFSDAIGERDTPKGRITVSISGSPMFAPQGEFLGYRGASRIVTRQIEAEQKARRADHLLRQAIEAFRISVMISDAEGQVVLANRHWQDQTHCTHQEDKGNWPDILRALISQGAYPDAVGQEDDYLRWRLNLHTETDPKEIRLRERWLLIKDHQLPDRSVVHFGMDITEHKQAAEKLRVSEELYRSVAATISDGLVIVELSGRVVALNPAASRILGVGHEQLLNLSSPSLLGLTLLSEDLSTPLPLPQWPIAQTLNEGRRVVDQVAPVRRPDGDIVWVEISSHLLRVHNDAPPFAAMATLRDITQQRHAQQALQLSEERWKFALEGAGDGVWDWDIGRGRVYYSQRWKALLGHEEHEVGTDIEELFRRMHPDDVDKAVESLSRYALHGDGVHLNEFRLRHKDGHHLAILSRGKVVRRDADGRALRMVGTHSDITPVKRAEQALREKHSAQAASAAKTEFLSRMSHEIRTPLNAITGFAQLLQLKLSQSGQEPVALKYADQILMAGHHLMGLVSDVLDLQKVEAGVLSVRLEPLPLAEEVSQCLAMLAPLASKRRITLVNLLDTAQLVLADRQRLRQVIMNIGSNAIKYNQTGGTVRIDTEALPGDWLALTIEDTGAGMSPQQLARLFQPFERLGRETSSTEGTGLGLIITRSLIQAMGGSMDIRSQPGAGTRVSLVLPLPSGHTNLPDQTLAKVHFPLQSDSMPAHVLAPPPAPNLAPMSPDTDLPLPPLRVLYVEDNRINAMLFEEALRPYPQIDLNVAEDGQMALSMAREQAPDVLVLDAHLPGMSGFEVLKALRVLPQLAQAPAFMCSADAMPEDVAKAKAAGFTGYWTKPIDIIAVTTELCRLAARGDNAAP